MDNLNALTLPTEAVKQQFSLWRSLGKNKGRIIPESLWEKVFPLFKPRISS